VRRGLRIYGKKRGTRSTGSGWVGRLALPTFFAMCLVGGGAMLTMLVRTHIIPEWRANRHYIPHQCTVLKTRIGQTRKDGAPLYRPEVLIRYQVDGHTYQLWTWSISHFQNENYTAGRQEKVAALRPFKVGQNCPCWYDPLNPGVAVVSRAVAYAAWAMLLLPISFIIIGTSGLGYSVVTWGKSAERRAALGQQAEQAVQLDLFDEEAAEEAIEYPQIPRDGNLTNSPGVKLAYRLPVASAHGWALFGLTIGAAAWITMVACFAVRSVNGFRQGEPNWLLTLLLLPFAAAGIGLVRLCIRRLLQVTGIGPTCVEISDHPLLPGRTYRVSISQAGHLRVNALELALVCEERATYQQGTNTRTDTRRVFEQSLLRREAFQIMPAQPYEAEADLAVPVDAMHSFRGKHNEVLWQLVVRGDVARWPGYRREFPVVVYPCVTSAVQA
jgi:hypothetical protein